MAIMVSIQHRLSRLQAQSTAAKVTADDSKAISDIAFVTMAESGTIDEVTATERISVFAEWQPNVAVVAGSLRSFGEGDDKKLYRCLQAHTTQAGWEPIAAPALWKLAGDPAEEWPAWSQPIGAVDAYLAGDKVSHGGGRWTSDVDGNVWEPGVYGWTQVL